MLVGVAIVSWSVLAGIPVLLGMNVGFVALIVNVVITVGGSLALSNRAADAAPETVEPV